MTTTFEPPRKTALPVLHWLAGFIEGLPLPAPISVNINAWEVDLQVQSVEDLRTWADYFDADVERRDGSRSIQLVSRIKGMAFPVAVLYVELLPAKVPA